MNIQIKHQPEFFIVAQQNLKSAILKYQALIFIVKKRQIHTQDQNVLRTTNKNIVRVIFLMMSSHLQTLECEAGTTMTF